MRNSTCLGVLSAALSCGLFISAANASVISTNQTASFETDNTNTTGNQHTGASTGTGLNVINYDRIGERTTSPANGVSMDVPFLLPTIPAGESIVSATLEVSTVNQTSNKPTSPADLYGISALTAAPPAGATPSNGGTIAGTPYYYSGATADPTSGVSLLQSGFLDSTNGTTAHNFTSNDISSFIQSIYTNNPTAAGQYLTLRLSYEGTSFSTANRYEVFLSQGTNLPQAAAVTPVLTITTTPEPASLGVIGLGGVTLLGRRRKSA
jgi:hypothetical protein